MSGPMTLVERHRAAHLVHEVCRPSSAAVIAHLPVRPGTVAPAQDVRDNSGLSQKDFWTTVSRLEALGVLMRTADGLSLARDHLDEMITSWVADSPLQAASTTRPRLAALIQWGRVVRAPTEPALIEELYAALAELFDAGEMLEEVDVNARIAAVHDDPAEVRRALVDRGLLLRTPGTAIYSRP